MIESVNDGNGSGPDLKNRPRRRKPATPDGAPKLDRLPPHSPEAEMGVLGSIMLSPNECMGDCIEKLKAGAEEFYDLRHQTIFSTLAEMYDARDAIDVITLQQRLKDKQLLEQVGGLTYLSTLPDTVPSSANLSYYLEIVREKYLLRKMIHVCTDVVGRVYDYEGEVDALMDEVERDILRISESRVTNQNNNIKDLVKKAINTIEEFHQRQGMLTGVPTGFADIDKMTSGLHGGEMIVIAARPSMGKCLAFDSEIVQADGSVATIEELYRRHTAELFTLNDRLRFETTRPSAYVDDGLKPVFRVTTRLGRRVEATLPHPFLTVRGWTKLAELKPGDHVAVPRKLEVFGRDRVRDCEIELWSKSAAEKSIPPMVFTLCRSQVALFLNRLFATDGWATVLASGQAQVGYATVSEKLARQIQHLLLRFGVVSSLKHRNVLYKGQRRPAWQLDITDHRSLQTFIFEIGIFGKEDALAAVQESLRGVGNANGRLRKDAEGTETPNRNRTARQRLECVELAPAFGRGGTFESAGKPGALQTLREFPRQKPSWQSGFDVHSRLQTLAAVLDNPALEDLAESDVYWDEIVSIEPLGLKQVYDLTIPETHNFVANDICVHNTSFAMNIAEHVAIDQKLPVGVFSLEMTAESLVLRMLCSRSRVNMRNVRDGFLAERDFPKLTGAAGKLANAPLFIDDSSGLSILQMRAKARRMHQQYGIKLFVIDYLQLLHSTSRRAENRQQEIADISSGVKALAKELDVPVIVLAQLNREMEKDKNRKPRMSDLRESGSIEQDADLIGMLYKPNSDDDEMPQTGNDGDVVVPVNLLIAKQRNGPTGDVHLTFLKSITRFENASKISDEDVQG